MDEGLSIIPGRWRSVYEYESSSRGQSFTDERDVTLYMVGRLIVVASWVPGPSTLVMHLTAKGSLLSGEWAERTDRDGYYEGATFTGVAQFILAGDGRSMSGAWAGHSRDMTTVNTGPWTFTYVEPWPGDLQSVPGPMTRGTP